MADSEEVIKAKIHDEFGRDWTIGRTYLDCEKTQPHWWMATRMRQLSDAEFDRGLARTLIYDTPRLLRAALAAQAELEER